MATPTTPRPGEVLQEVVQRLTTVYLDLFNKQDVEGVLGFYAPDAVMLGPDQPGVKGKEAIRELLQTMYSTGFGNVALGRNSMASLGDLAVDIGYYSAIQEFRPGAKREGIGKYVTAWRRQPNGEFLITVMVWSTNL